MDRIYNVFTFRPYFSWILILAFIVSCSLSSNKVIINGKVPQGTAGPVLLSNFDCVDTAKIKQNKFRLQTEIETFCYANLKLGNKFIPIYIEPGKTIDVELINDSDLDTLVFIGDLKSENKFLYNKSLHNKISSANYSNLINSNPNVFINKLDSIKKAWQTSLNAFELSRPFKELEEKAIEFRIVRLKLEYCITSPNKHYIKNQAEFINIEQFSLNDSLFLSQKEFTEFVSTYTDYLTNKELDRSIELLPHEITLLKMQLISRHFENGPVKDYLLYNTLNEHIHYYSLNNTELLFRTFAFQCANTNLKQRLIQPYQKYLALNNRGYAPDIEFSDLKNTSLNLQQFKGSYLYIDVWATWCTPCKRETPFFDELKIKHSNQNIEFISLSVDDSREKWEKYCIKHKKNEHQYWVNDKLKFLDDYMIKTIPRFIIIDPEGKIIDADAPRPSENKNDWLTEIPTRNET